MIKLNLGASPIWEGEGWHILDHKLTKTEGFKVAGDASEISLPDNSTDIVFCSHIFEHIPHTQLPMVLSEINRILKPGGILRILTPDLEKITKAYVYGDKDFFTEAKLEDESLRTDLGYGGMLMNFIVSPGQDTALFDRGLNDFIAGYAHLYSYDYSMLEIMMTKLGFKTRKASFCDSEIEEMNVPLHVKGLQPKWQNLNQEFYEKNNLRHTLVNGKYEINFKVCGFDRDPLTSLIIEAKKEVYFDKDYAHKLFNLSQENYNRYSYSLLNDNKFSEKIKKKGFKIKTV